MFINKDIEVNADIELNPREIFRNLSSREKEELLDLILNEKLPDSNYYLEGLFLGKKDHQILTDKKIWDKLIRFIKYEDSTLKDYIIEELSYEPTSNPKINIT
jgi:hypothetical protein